MSNNSLIQISKIINNNIIISIRIKEMHITTSNKLGLSNNLTILIKITNKSKF